MTALIYAEGDAKGLKPQIFNVVTAAAKLDRDVHVLVVGKDAQSQANEAAKIAGVLKVICVSDAAYEFPIAENIAATLLSLADNYDVLLAAASTTGKDVMPRVAAKLDIQQLSDIIDVIDASTVVRPIYAGNVFATVSTSDAKKVITVRPTAFDKAASEGGSAEIVQHDAVTATNAPKFVSMNATDSDKPDLSSANIVVSGGRAMGSKEDFDLIEKFADKLGAAVGASRAAVDAGYAPNDYQVGQTGKIVAPDLYIAVGISGAIQHLAGMKDSKVIVAINKDENAPIFEVADYGLVADLFDAVPEIMQKL